MIKTRPCFLSLVAAPKKNKTQVNREDPEEGNNDSTWIKKDELQQKGRSLKLAHCNREKNDDADSEQFFERCRGRTTRGHDMKLL